MPGVITKLLHCDFVRNAETADLLTREDFFQANIDYELAGFHFSTSLFNRSTFSAGAWLIINDAPILNFSNTAGIRLLASQCLVRSSALGVDQFSSRSEHIEVVESIAIRSGQSVSLYAFSSTLNTQRTFATIALFLRESRRGP